jgi:mannosyl-3-phosphoglycerate phosphatase
MITHENSLLVVTDLDGTLLDATTYEFSAAREALDALRTRAIPIVLATSKTLSEAHEVAAAIGGHPILIVENGGAAVIPAAYAVNSDEERLEDGALVIEMGVAREWLSRQLAEISAETGARLRGFDQLTISEVAALTGLSLNAARMARERRYDEPFLVEGTERIPEVQLAAHSRGLSVTRGGRFFHLTGPSTKGRALETILERFGRRGHRFVTVGLGDAPNDLSFLRLVDRPVVMPHRGGRLDPALVAALPHCERATEEGPRGWNLAVMAILAGRRLPSVGGAVSA